MRWHLQHVDACVCVCKMREERAQRSAFRTAVLRIFSCSACARSELAHTCTSSMRVAVRCTMSPADRRHYPCRLTQHHCHYPCHVSQNHRHYPQQRTPIPGCQPRHVACLTITATVHIHTHRYPTHAIQVMLPALHHHPHHHQRLSFMSFERPSPSTPPSPPSTPLVLSFSRSHHSTYHAITHQLIHNVSAHTLRCTQQINSLNAEPDRSAHRGCGLTEDDEQMHVGSLGRSFIDEV